MKICKCTTSDIPDLMNFIDQYWRKDHVLAREEAVLKWYYANPDGCNFLLAKRDGEIFAVLGFIDSDRFYNSVNEIESSELWLALWKVREDVAVPGLGLRLILELKKLYPERSISVLGLSEEASKIYSLLRYEVKTLDQLFIYNRKLNDSKLLSGNLPEYNFLTFSGTVSSINNPNKLREDLTLIRDSRRRGPEYFINRYLENPFNEYQAYRIHYKSQCGYAIGRVVTANGGSALRLVDFYGDLALLGASLCCFVEHIEMQGIEFMDLYICGDESHKLQKSGFINRADCDKEIVVPNYFEPFVAKNIDLQCAMEKGFSGPVFKADGDQERPNRVN